MITTGNLDIKNSIVFSGILFVRALPDLLANCLGGPNLALIQRCVVVYLHKMDWVPLPGPAISDPGATEQAQPKSSGLHQPKDECYRL